MASNRIEQPLSILSQSLQQISEALQGWPEAQARISYQTEDALIAALQKEFARSPEVEKAIRSLYEKQTATEEAQGQLFQATPEEKAIKAHFEGEKLPQNFWRCGTCKEVSKESGQAYCRFCGTDRVDKQKRGQTSPSKAS